MDTLTDTTSSLGSISNNCQSTFYNAITNKAYFVVDGNVKVVDCIDNSVQNITLPFGSQAIGYGISLDGNYAYVNNFFASKTIARLDMITTGSVTAFSGTFSGDPLKGTMGWDNKMYMGCGGGSSGSQSRLRKSWVPILLEVFFQQNLLFQKLLGVSTLRKRMEGNKYQP